jgi:hypothetical protein
MEDIETAAPLVVGALQQWYGADPYALQFGLYSYADPALDAHWGKWNNFKQISRNLVNSAIILTGQRDRMQDTAQWWISAKSPVGR